MKRALVIWPFFLLCLITCVHAQDSTQKEKKLFLKGYLKEMPGLVFSPDSVKFDNLVHNRMNLRWYPTASLSFGAEVRTRFFYGNTIHSNPGYVQALDRDSGLVDLSFVLAKGDKYALHTIMDRAWINWQKGKWEVRLGRQRINWGISQVWNPNDLFNTFSYLDFDYEERPGSDAVRVQRYLGAMSSAELAVKPGKKWNEHVIAGNYKFNKHGYDVQIIGGLYKGEAALGTGWAGNIKKFGFKGEAMAFYPVDSNDISAGSGLVSVSLDYMTKKSTLFMISALYNSNGQNKPLLFDIRAVPLSPKSLSPFRYSLFAQTMVTFTSIFQGSLGVILNPADQTFLFVPTLSVSIKNNLDLLLLGQIISAEFPVIGRTTGGVVYTRLKWSF